MPFSRLRLMMRTMGTTIEEMVSWRHFALMSLGPDDLLGSSDCTMPITSFSVTGEREKEGLGSVPGLRW